MGEVIITFEILPESPDTNLEEVSKKASEVLNNFGAKILSRNVEPFVFGLKKLIIKVLYPEKEFDEEKVTEELEKIEGVQSCEITNVTRSFI